MPYQLDQEALDSPSLKMLDINKPPTKNIAHQEFPKMVYLHPKDKTLEHRTLVVESADELATAEAKGYKVAPHVPQAPVEDMSEFDTEFEVADPLNSMTKSELIDYAREYGVTVNPQDNKATILAAIKGK